MLFDIQTALKIRLFYKDILIGLPLTNEPELTISGLFICHKGNAHKAIEIIINKEFNEKYPLIGVTDEKEKNLEIYVYGKHGDTLFFEELDKNLSSKKIEKIYITN